MALLDAPLVTLTQPLRNTPTVFLLTLHNGIDNRITRELLAAINQVLDKIDQLAPENGALITTGRGKFYSNGFNIAQLNALGVSFREDYLKLLARIITFRLPTVAAINGHAFAAGCMLALAHDYRVMRKDRGYICMNEVDIRRPLQPAMAAIVRVKIGAPNVFRDCVIGGKRFGGFEAVECGIVDEAVDESLVVACALDLAEKYREKAYENNLQLLKAEMYRDLVKLLLNPIEPPAEYLAKL